MSMLLDVGLHCLLNLTSLILCKGSHFTGGETLRESIRVEMSPP